MYPRKPEHLLARDEQHLSKLVAQAFSQRRKMLRNTLSEMVTQAQLEICGIAPTARAEELSVAQFVHLSNYLLSL
jgi:16S rRNA (adenine1518-N6/adenine1519-N6)-dimethyltransferase